MNALRSILEKVKESTMLICIDGKPVGTGLAISRYGIIITCNHVIGEETNLEVKKGKTILSAKVYKRSPENDIAILKVENGLPFLDSLLEPVTIENVEEVYVIGYPIFDRPSITKGIVSAIDRDSEGIIKYIQISAQINKGNSGGPVVSAESGRVIGIVTTKHKHSEGISFCIPINAIFSVISRYEIDPLLFNWDKYIEAVLEKHGKGSHFKHHIALKCSDHKGDSKDLMEYVTEVWLPDKSKSVLAVLGEFGSGKTIFCHKLAYILAQRIKKKRKL